MPPCASDAAPGVSVREPPPISAAMVTLWCGAWKGGRRTRAVPVGTRPATEWRDVVTRAVSGSRSGRIVGRREASMVLPEPGSPSRKTWCPPAAATSIAATASGWPRTSAMSSGGWASTTLHTSRTPSRPWKGALIASPPPQAIRSARWAKATTSIPETSAASRAQAAGTMTRRTPCERAASTAGSTPRTGWMLPSRASSPTITLSSKARGITRPVASAIDEAMARSNAEPDFGMPAGDRLTVMR